MCTKTLKKEKTRKSKRKRRSYDLFITMHGHDNFYLVGRLVVRVFSLGKVKSLKSYFTERQTQVSCARHSYVIYTLIRCH